jgi:CBS-domain-containing membrane protein
MLRTSDWRRRCRSNPCGPAPWAAALAIGLAMVAMHLTGTFHPPAGIDPLLVVVNDMSWSFLVAPVGIGALLLALFAFVWHNLVARGANRAGISPTRWWWSVSVHRAA